MIQADTAGVVCLDLNPFTLVTLTKNDDMFAYVLLKVNSP